MASDLVPAANLGAGQDVGNDFNQKPSEEEQQVIISAAQDNNVQPLEVYLHWAAIEREREANDNRPIPDSPWTILFKKIIRRSDKIVRADYSGDDIPPPLPTGTESQRFVENPVNILKIGHRKSVSDDRSSEKSSEFDAKPELYSVESASAISSTNTQDESSKPVDEEQDRLYRILRVASWQASFYLITTDILGFTAAPETFNELGIGPGVLVYTVFYLLAVFAGQVIWKLYLSLDSSKYPIVGYADLGERMFGKVARHVFNIIQSTQLLFNVALLIIGNGQTLEAVIDYKFCYLAINIFFMLVGMVGGQIRSLRNFAWFANVNIWLNILTMVLTIVGIEKFLPAPSVSNHANLHQPVMVSGWVPSYTKGWYQQVSGVQLAVFAYGGAMIFPEFMAEMRRPRDFWKSLLCAQLFCYVCYMLFGLIIYIRQGQYSSILPNIDFQSTSYILVNNIINLTTIEIAAVLYGNIGVKLFYKNVMQQYFKAPALMSTKGRWMWTFTVCAYWAVAWLIGTAIPNITSLVTLVGAACILQFTYTFPPLLLLGFWTQVDACKGDRPWAPGMPAWSNRVDTWRNKSRWIRGLKRYWYIKLFLALMVLGALANCALGIYAGIESAIEGYKKGYDIPFSCYAPGDPAVN